MMHLIYGKFCSKFCNFSRYKLQSSSRYKFFDQPLAITNRIAGTNPVYGHESTYSYKAVTKEARLISSLKHLIIFEKKN